MKRLASFLKDCCGSMAIFTVIMMFVFVGLLAFVIDLSHVQNVKTELSNAADDCALRGARAFFPDNMDLELTNEDPDPARAKAQAQVAIQDNRSDDNAYRTVNLVDLPQAEIQVGIWDYTGEISGTGTPTLLPWQWPPPPNWWGYFIGPGVRLPVRRDDTHNRGQVITTLASIFGIRSVPVQAWATAALSGMGKMSEATPGSFPIAVDEDKLKDMVYGSQNLLFLSPDSPDDGGWTSMSLDPASASEFKGLINHSIPNPELDVDDWIALQNGVACTAIKEAIDYYYTVEVSKGIYELRPPAQVEFPVVQVDTFNKTAQVKGFACATIDVFRDANAPKDILIPGSEPPKYTGDCMIILTLGECIDAGNEGEGRYYGLLATRPKLVGQPGRGW